MNKAYNRTTWENYPSDNTPLNETNLNHLEIGVDEIDNRVISLDTKKFDKTEAAGLIKSFELDKTTGIITVTKYNGSVQKIDTLLEKIAVNFDFDSTTQKLIITLDDGTTKEIDLSAFITQYEFLDSDTIAFTVDSAGKVKAIVKEGSILEKHLQPNYLADIKTEVAKAEASRESASLSADKALTSEKNAKSSENTAKSYAVGQTDTRVGEDTDNAKYYKEQSETYLSSAQQIKKDVLQIKSDTSDILSQVEQDKQEIDETIKNSLLSSSEEIIDSIKDYFTRAQALYDAMYLNCDGETPQLRVVTLINIKGGTPQQRVIDYGISFDGGTPLNRLLGT